MSPLERTLWTLTAHPRSAWDIQRSHPDGSELRVVVGGQLVCSRVFAPTCAHCLEEAAEEYRRDLMGSGWLP